MKLPRILAGLFFLAAVLVGTSGCRSFESEWAAAGTASHPANDPLAGRWIGTWQNTNNAHGGALRAVIGPATKTQRLARFHATWGNHSGSFTSPLTVEAHGDTISFVGKRRILGFLITTRGEAGHGQFHATYQSAFDNGTFTLHRVDGAAAPQP